MVEHKLVERAMSKFGTALKKFKAAPEANETALKNACYRLAHAIRSGIEEAWGVAAPPTSQE